MPHKKKELLKLSPGELEILELLWNSGPQSIAEAHQLFTKRGRKIGYPTVQTRLNRLVVKGILRKNGEYPAKYEAVLQESDVSGKYFDLLETLCGGSLAPLMIHLCGKRSLKPNEIEILKEILKQNEKEAS